MAEKQDNRSQKKENTQSQPQNNKPQNNRYKRTKNRSGNSNRNKRKSPPVNRNKISETFMKSDFSCKCGECKESFRMSLALVGVLESVALKFELKPNITKGFLCENAASKLESIKKNYHAMGKAVDFQVPKEKLVEVFKYLETLPEIRGLGIDYEKDNIHIDTREKEPVKWAKINGEREDLTKEIRDRYGFGDEIVLERKDFLTA